MVIGIISDIHEDVERLFSAVKALEKNNCDRIICLGDISGFDDRFYSYKYSRNLKYCIDLIKSNCRDVIPGNHDYFHLKMLANCNSVFDFPDNWNNLSITEKKHLSKGRIWLYENDSEIKCHDEFLSCFTTFSNSLIIEEDGIRILFSHSVYPDIWGILVKKPSKLKEFSEHFSLLEQKKCDIGFSGHLHPNGLLVVTKNSVNIPRYNETEIPASGNVQYIVPCIADGIQDNGFCILDTKERIVKTFHLRTPRHKAGWL